jgi:hypothetical protein
MQYYGRPSTAHATIGIFALGLTPVLPGFWFVELAAMAVPRWRRLRHSGPAGRAKLERASLVLAAVLAIAQAFGLAMSIRSAADTPETPMNVSIPLLMATMVGGTFVCVAAARLVSRYGMINGYIAILAAQAAVATVDVFAGHLRDAGSAPQLLATPAAGALLIVLAVSAAIQGVASFGGATTADDGSGYRDLPRLVLHPRIPIPASAFAPYTIAANVVSFVQVGLGPAAFAHYLNGDATWTAAWLAALVPITIGVALLLHRPAELADLASRLGASQPREIAVAWRSAVWRAIVPTLLLFAGMMLVTTAFQVRGWDLMFLVMAGTDLVHALRAPAPLDEGVVVIEERRAAVVPMLRAALAAEGIASDVRGAATLACLQVFAPYAPAEIVVAPGDADRAGQTLRHLLFGDEAPPAPTAPRAPWSATDTTWALGRKSIVFVACVVAAVTRPAMGQRPSEVSRDPIVPRANLEIVRVDDSIDPFTEIRDEELPEGQGISLFTANEPLGPGKNGVTHFARITLAEHETPGAAAARVRPWLATIPLPEGARFVFQEDHETDDGGRELPTVEALRTIVVRGESVITTPDVTGASARAPHDMDTTPYVIIELSSSGAERFEAATAGWINRRRAILVDGVVSSAPVIKTTIHGGKLSITLGAGDPDARIEEGRRLAGRLAP